MTKPADFLDELTKKDPKAAERLRKAQEAASGPPPLTPAQWGARRIEPEDFLLGAPFSTTSRGMISAETGKGKTMLCVGIAYAMHLGRGFLHWQARRPARVLYIDGEMPTDLMLERIRLGAQWFAADLPSDGPFFMSREDFEDMPPLDSDEWQAWISPHLDTLRPDFLILDNLMSLTVGNLKETDSWQKVKPWIGSLARRKTGLLLVHHLGHDKAKSYGDSTKEWALDYVALGEGVDDPEADVSLKLEFKKARRRRPDTLADFAPGLATLKGGEWTWTAADKSAPSSGRLPAGALNVLAGLEAALAACGEKPPHHAVTAKVARAVELETWRSYFSQTAGYEQDKKGKDAERKAFDRGKDQLKAARKVGIWGGWAWLG